MSFIHGLLFRIAALSFGEYKSRVEQYKYHTSNNFLETYNEHLAAMDIVAESAKVYIVENWKKVNNWSNLNIKILDNTGEVTEYYKYVPEKRLKKNKDGSKQVRNAFLEVIREINKDNKKKHNPIVSVDNVYLDHTDGDFSICINGKDHLWIDNNSIILIANYIEKNI